MEIADDVFVEHAIPEQAEEKTWDGEEDHALSHLGFLADIVNRFNGYLRDPEVVDIQFGEDIVGNAVSLVDVVHVQGTQRAQGYGRVPGLGIHHAPVA